MPRQSAVNQSDSPIDCIKVTTIALIFWYDVARELTDQLLVTTD
jgi:hypothetical protein